MDEAVRAEAQLALIESFKDRKLRDEGVRGQIQSLLNSDAPGARLAAVEILTAYGDETSIDWLLTLLDDGNAAVRKKAAQALGNVGNPSRSSGCWRMSTTLRPRSSRPRLKHFYE